MNRLVLLLTSASAVAGAACLSSNAPPQAPMTPAPAASSAASASARPLPAADAATATASGDPLSCEHVADEAKEEDGVAGAKELCRSYRDEMVPATAGAAIACMRDTGWSYCSRSACTLRALQAAPVVTDPRCAKVERACAGMGELCAAHISGLNAVGKARFTKCLIESCGIGLRICLWDSSTTPCDERMP